MQGNLQSLLAEVATEFNPPRILKSVEWIPDNYYLPDLTGFSGSYQFERSPYFVGVAMALDDRNIYEVDLMKASQIGWTYFILGYLFARVASDPCPIMGIFAKEKDAKAFHDEKLVPTALVNSDITDLMDVSTSRKSGNRWDLKNYPGGFLKLVGSNSPGNVKSTSSVGVLFVEEPDDTSDNVANQGDAIGNGEERLKRYTGNKKLIVGGTPAVKGFSKTEARLARSDCRVLPIVCHDCGESHVLNWDNVWWQGKDSDDPKCDIETGEITVARHEIYGFSQPDTAVYICPDCGEHWDDYQRQKNIRDTVYEALDAGDPLAGWVATRPFNGIAGFSGLSELYVCIDGTSLAQVVQEYLAAEKLSDQGDQSMMIKFINQKLGKPYEYESDAPDSNALESRADEYSEMVVPDGGLVLTAGVDVQHDRLAVVIRAWGRGEESWLLYWGELSARKSVTDVTDPVWAELDSLLFSPINHERGFQMRMSAVSIDSSDGQTNDAVYDWVRPRQRRNVMAIKGASNDYGNREIYSRPRNVDHKNKTKAAAAGLAIHVVGTHKSKDLLFGDKGRLTLTGSGPGRMHWYKDVRQDYYDHITAEVKAPHKSMRGKLVWQCKAGARNEAMDCEVYALHAARYLKLHRMLPSAWDDIEKKLTQSDLFTPPESVAVPQIKPVKKAGRVISRGVEL